MKRNLTINVCLDDADHPRLAEMLHYHLTDWCDGRYPLSVELLVKSLHECLRSALHAAIEDDKFKQHGSERVQTSPNSWISKAYLEANAEYDKTPKPYVRLDTIRVAIAESSDCKCGRGVRGNENIVYGEILCDYCCAERKQ